MLESTLNYFPSDGKALVVAMDHGMIGALVGFKNPKTTLLKILEGGPDGILITPNFVRNFKNEISKKTNIKINIRVDLMATSTIPGLAGDEEIQLQFSDVEECLEVGADAIVTLLIFGRENPEVIKDNIKYVAALSKITHHYHIPLVVEVPFWGKVCPKESQERSKFLEDACRIAFEIGADIIKAPYLQDRRAFRNLTSNLPIPILILGGEKMNTNEEILVTVKNSLEDGGRGIYFGRNIWQNEDPIYMIKTLYKIIHEGSSIKEVLKDMKK